MDIDFKDFELDDTYRVLYNGKHIGDWSSAGRSYPLSVSGLNGEQLGSFASEKEALRFLLIFSGVLGASYQIDANIFPDGNYILRASSIMLIADPDPSKTLTVTAKIHYNSKTTYGKSAASKPVKVAVMDINLDDEIFTHGKKVIEFENQEEIIRKIRLAVSETIRRDG